MRRFGLVIGLALASLACGDDQPDDLGELCSSVSEAACKRLQQCDPSTPFNVCFQASMGGCCVDKVRCGAAVREGVTWSDVDACVGALGQVSCTDLAGGVMPPDCLRW